MLRIIAHSLSLLAASGLPTSDEPAVPASSGPADVAATVELDDEPRQRFRLGRAGLEIAAAMALGAGWYQSEIELNKLDFDFDRTFQDQTRRLFTRDGYRFDDNNQVLNVGHAFVGAYYHQFARQNGGGMLEALAFDFLTSTTWELFVEHREVVSVNDTIMTTFAAVPIGETLFQLGDYFGRSRPTVVNRALMTLFSPAHGLALLWGEAPAGAGQAGHDDRGLARDAHRDFSFTTGATRALADRDARAAEWQADLRLDLELVNLASYGHQGHRHRPLGGGEFTRLTVDYLGGQDGLRNLRIASRASLWGLYLQDTRASATGLRGHAIFLGTATAFDLSVEDRGIFNDFVAALHLIGPTADVTLHRDRLSLRLTTDITPDFAMVRPFALDPALTTQDLAGSKSTIKNHRYYYAMGLATAARAEARYRRARAGAVVHFDQYDSIQGLDRHQRAYTSPTGRHHPAISEDVEASDQRLRLRLYGDSGLPLTDLRLGVSLDYGQRSGDYGAVTRTEEDVRVAVLASYRL
jgi:hypothetical protein